MNSTKFKTIHRRITIIALIPLLLVTITGSLYSILQFFDVYAFWLIKIHAGNFFIINLQPIYGSIIGFITFFAIISGIFLFPKSKKL